MAQAYAELYPLGLADAIANPLGSRRPLGKTKPQFNLQHISLLF
jgi:hypothetical protein